MGHRHSHPRSRSRLSTASRSVWIASSTIFEPMREQIDAWQKYELTDLTAKVVIYEALVEGKLEGPKHLVRTVHDLYFEPNHEEFRQRTIWDLSNAFTSVFRELNSIPQFKATANLENSWTFASPRCSNHRRHRRCVFSIY